jgi:hypothetical protein
MTGAFDAAIAVTLSVAVTDKATMVRSRREITAGLLKRGGDDHIVAQLNAVAINVKAAMSLAAPATMCRRP